MAQGVFAFVGILLVGLAGCGVTAGRVRLELLGAALIAAALLWQPLTVVLD